MSEERLNNKVALITGGAMGIGAACAKTLSLAGATVVITDVLTEEGEKTAADIVSAGGKARFLPHDVTQESAWETVIANIRDTEKRLDVLVNNAGIAIVSPITEMSLADFQKQNAVNLDGVFLGMKHGIPLMADSGGGSIINLSSVAGLRGAANFGGYCMTKGGVRLLTKSVAKECALAGNKIRVNSVHPGIIETAIWDKMGLPPTDGANRTETEQIAASSVPGGVLGQPTDIANGVLFLASDESSYMTGSELVIDHGHSA